MARLIRPSLIWRWDTGLKRRRPNFLLVHCSDLLHDLDAEMQRIAGFLEIPIDGSIWPSLVRAAEFPQMQSAGDLLMPHLRTVLTDGSRRFFNKGTNGRLRDVLGASELAAYEANIRCARSSFLGYARGLRRAASERANREKVRTEPTFIGGWTADWSVDTRSRVYPYAGPAPALPRGPTVAAPGPLHCKRRPGLQPQ
jgi:Sulfotransferase domain